MWRLPSACFISVQHEWGRLPHAGRVVSVILTLSSAACHRQLREGENLPVFLSTVRRVWRKCFWSDQQFLPDWVCWGNLCAWKKQLCHATLSLWPHALACGGYLMSIKLCSQLKLTVDRFYKLMVIIVITFFSPFLSIYLLLLYFFSPLIHRVQGSMSEPKGFCLCCSHLPFFFIASAVY